LNNHTSKSLVQVSEKRVDLQEDDSQHTFTNVEKICPGHGAHFRKPFNCMQMILLNYKHVFIYCLFLLLHCKMSSQVNMVPDSSFEDTTGTVNGSLQMSLNQWRNLDSTKLFTLRFVYLSYITQTPPYSLPNNQWFYQHSHSGGGVAECSFVWYPNANWKRALTRTKLRTALTAGKTYCAKMYVNPCDKFLDTFTDGIQMYFDNGQLDTIVAIDSSGVYPFVNPQVSNPAGNILSDTMNWTLVSGMFVATGNETFLTIGNFKTDSNTQRAINFATYNATNPVNASSLLIDDVSVIEVNVSNWLHDTSIVLGDSVYIGLPVYEVPDALWYDINMNYIGKGSGIKVKPTQWATQYIQAIDVCSSIRYDTMTVWAAPLAIHQLNNFGMGQVEIYPNPTSAGFDLKSNCNENCAVKVEVLNLNGQRLLERNCDLLMGNCFVILTLLMALIW
jgi:hypothetical protein